MRIVIALRPLIILLALVCLTGCHQHDWEEKMIVYAAPVGLTNFEHKFGSTDYLDRWVLGYTTIIYECETCKATKKVEALGKSCDQ